MWERLFGWSKASKCKALVKIVMSRLKLLRNKRITIIKQLRLDVAQLLRNNEVLISLKRVELLCKEQNVLDGYDMIERFCECILERLSYIRRHKDRPEDINEAVSSLIFASARCADLPELQRLRTLFAKRYGFEFSFSAVELHPNSCVNQQIIEKLSDGLPTSDLKLNLMKGISTEFNIQWDLNIEAELGKPTTDPRAIEVGGWEKFISCHNGISSSCHPLLLSSYINGNDNIKKSSDTIKEQDCEYSNVHNETLPGYSDHEDQMFERDIAVVSSSVKEICSIPISIVKTSGVEKQEPSPSEKGLQSGCKHLGIRSAGQKFVRGMSVDSYRVYNLNSDDLGYNSTSAAEPAARAASVAANLSKCPKPPRETSLFDCPLDYISENEETTDRKGFHESDVSPLKSKHLRSIHTARNGYSRSQTCFPERRELLSARASELKSTSYPTANKSEKNQCKQSFSSCDGDRRRLPDCLKGQINTETGSPRNPVNVHVDKSMEDDRHRWCSPRSKALKADIQNFVVDNSGGTERYAELWGIRDEEYYLKDSIEIDVPSRHTKISKPRKSSRSRKKVRSETRRRHSLSSHSPIEINGFYHDYYNSSTSGSDTSAYNAPDHCETVSSKNVNRARELYKKNFVEPRGVVTFKKYSDRGINTRVIPQQFYHDKVRSVRHSGRRLSYDMMHSYFYSSSDDEVFVASKNIHRARDSPSPLDPMLQSRTTVERGKNRNEDRSFEAAQHDTKDLFMDDSNHVEKWRSNQATNDFQPPQNEEMLHSISKQMFYVNELACSVGLTPNGLQRNMGEGSSIAGSTFEGSLGKHSYKLQKQWDEGSPHSLDDSLSDDSLNHLENYDSDVEQHIEQPNDTRRRSKSTFIKKSKYVEGLHKVGKTSGNKSQNVRNRSLDLSHKHPHGIDIDSSDMDDQNIWQSRSIRKVRNADSEINSESVRRDSDYNVFETKPCRGRSKLQEGSCEETDFAGEIYNGFSAKRIENFCTPRLSFVYLDRNGDAHQHHNLTHYMGKNDINRFLRLLSQKPDCSSEIKRQHSTEANSQGRINLGKNEEMEKLLLTAHGNPHVSSSTTRNLSGGPDQIDSLNQSVSVEKPSTRKISSKNLVNRNLIGGGADTTPSRPPLSPAKLLLGSKPHRSGPSMGPPERPPPELPRKWERVMSMPPERPKNSPVSSSIRSQSMQFIESPRTPHVHPKLPNYDDIAAQFTALKQQYKTSTASE